MNAMINIGMFLVYILLVCGLLAIVGFSAMQFARNVKSSRTVLFALLALVVVFVVSYLCARTTDVSAALIDKLSVSKGTLKMLGAGMNMIYILLCATVLSLVGFEAAKFFKK